ncbi:MAG: helix-turn-helix transcriptional regulator [Bifidobacterium crudilactis]
MQIDNDQVNHVESVVSWNVKTLLAAQGKAQSALAGALGIQRATISNKIKGRIAWSLADLVRAAAFLETSPEYLMDDSLMKQLQNLGNNKTVAADTRPRYLVMPSDGEVCPGCDSNARHLL